MVEPIRDQWAIALGIVVLGGLLAWSSATGWTRRDVRRAMRAGARRVKEMKDE